MRIGNKELEVLRFIARWEEASVYEVFNHFGERWNVGRTTILKTMERLLAKGFLERELYGRVYVYRVTMDPDEIQEKLTEQFVQETLDGSIKPFFAYLNSALSLTKEESEELSQLMLRLIREAKER